MKLSLATVLPEKAAKQGSGSEEKHMCVICGSELLEERSIVGPPRFSSEVPQIVVDKPAGMMVQMVCKECATVMLFAL